MDAELQERAARFSEAARRYSGFGWALIPLNGKVPRAQQWQAAAPAAPEFAAGLWSRHGRRYEMGVPLGPSGLAVIEDDTKEGRAKLLELLGGELPRVPTVRSGGRSMHLYFSDEGYEPASRDGLELRCGRQQCAVPPSVHPETGREYVWVVPPEEAELVPVPQAVLDFFAGSKGRLFADPVEPEIRKPGRHKALLSIAGTLRRRGLGADEIAVSLLAVNERRCKPPLLDDEVLELARDVARRYAPEPPDLEQERIEREAARRLDGDVAVPIPIPSRRKRELRRRAVSTIAAKAVEWLIANVAPLSTLTMVAGVGGLGKSMLALAWGAEVTREGSNVLVVSYEDAAEQVIRPRFEALNGELERLFVLELDPTEGSISFPIDLAELARHVRETDARLVLIDPVSASIDLKLDAHKDRDVRVVLGQLAKLAEELRVAVVMIAHLNKAPGSDPYLRINGSTAFYNASRSVLTVTRDPGEELYRLIGHHKSNYGVLAPVERWALEVVDVSSVTGPISVARLVFLEVADDVSRDDLLAPPSPAGKRPSAELLIAAELAFGSKPSAEVKAAGVEIGISERTMQRAAQEIEVVVEEEVTDTGRVTYWSLPEGVAPRPTSGHLARPPSDRITKPDKGDRANSSKRGRDATPQAT